MSAANFVQLLLSGLAMGAIYALTATGLFIAHLATTRLNFGQGDFLMFAAYLSMALLLAGVPVLLVMVVVLVVLALMGWALERFAIRPLLGTHDNGRRAHHPERSHAAVGKIIAVLPTALVSQSPERRAGLRRRSFR
jgi:branched-subunit amino acid ABC-type transport system permease component